MWIIWIFVKLIAAGIGVLWGLSTKNIKASETEHFQGQECFVHYGRHKGGIVNRSIGIDHEGPKFRLVRESSWDKRYKNWGLSTEIQTGDREFDDLVFVISDNPLLATHLSLSQETRDSISEILASEYHEIRCDGKKLWILAKGSSDAGDGDFEHVLGLSQTMGDLKARSVPLYREPFFVKATITEAVLFALGGYAAAGFMEYAFSRESLVLDPHALMTSGLWLALMLFVSLVAVVRYLFHGSSRGHRVIAESVFLLLFSLPIAGIHLVMDFDVGLDASPEFVVRTPISRVEERYHSTKNGHYYTYHTHFTEIEADGVKLPSEIAVGREIYTGQQGDKILELTLKKGALDIPWIRGVRWAKEQTN